MPAHTEVLCSEGRGIVRHPTARLPAARATPTLHSGRVRPSSWATRPLREPMGGPEGASLRPAWRGRPPWAS
eukprot:7383564-Prymnesium_polylepis.2